MASIQPIMRALTEHQVELLHRVRCGDPVWGGNVPLADLQAAVEQLQLLRLIEPIGLHTFRLTAIGFEVIGAITGSPGIS
jgi:hypothetical protein